MALIARYTGWPEAFILWELPLERAFAYTHAFMRLNNVKTVRPLASDPLLDQFLRVTQPAS